MAPLPLPAPTTTVTTTTILGLNTDTAVYKAASARLVPAPLVPRDNGAPGIGTCIAVVTIIVMLLAVAYCWPSRSGRRFLWRMRDGVDEEKEEGERQTLLRSGENRSGEQGEEENEDGDGGSGDGDGAGNDGAADIIDEVAADDPASDSAITDLPPRFGLIRSPRPLPRTSPNVSTEAEGPAESAAAVEEKASRADTGTGVGAEHPNRVVDGDINAVRTFDGFSEVRSAAVTTAIEPKDAQADASHASLDTGYLTHTGQSDLGIPLTPNASQEARCVVMTSTVEPQDDRADNDVELEAEHAGNVADDHSEASSTLNALESASMIDRDEFFSICSDSDHVCVSNPELFGALKSQPDKIIHDVAMNVYAEFLRSSWEKPQSEHRPDPEGQLDGQVMIHQYSIEHRDKGPASRDKKHNPQALVSDGDFLSMFLNADGDEFSRVIADAMTKFYRLATKPPESEELQVPGCTETQMEEIMHDLEGRRVLFMRGGGDEPLPKAHDDQSPSNRGDDNSPSEEDENPSRDADLDLLREMLRREQIWSHAQNPEIVDDPPPHPSGIPGVPLWIPHITDFEDDEDLILLWDLLCCEEDAVASIIRRFPESPFEYQIVMDALIARFEALEPDDWRFHVNYDDKFAPNFTRDDLMNQIDLMSQQWWIERHRNEPPSDDQDYSDSSEEEDDDVDGENDNNDNDEPGGPHDGGQDMDMDHDGDVSGDRDDNYTNGYDCDTAIPSIECNTAIRSIERTTRGRKQYLESLSEGSQCDNSKGRVSQASKTTRDDSSASLAKQVEAGEYVEVDDDEQEYSRHNANEDNLLQPIWATDLLFATKGVDEELSLDDIESATTAFQRLSVTTQEAHEKSTLRTQYAVMGMRDSQQGGYPEVDSSGSTQTVIKLEKRVDEESDDTVCSVGEEDDQPETAGSTTGESSDGSSDFDDSAGLSCALITRSETDAASQLASALPGLPGVEHCRDSHPRRDDDRNMVPAFLCNLTFRGDSTYDTYESDEDDSFRSTAEESPDEEAPFFLHFPVQPPSSGSRNGRLSSIAEGEGEDSFQEDTHQTDGETLHADGLYDAEEGEDWLSASDDDD